MIIKLINGKLVKVIGEPNGDSAKLEFSDEALAYLQSDWRANLAKKIFHAPLVQDEPEFEEDEDEDIEEFIGNKYGLNGSDFNRNEPEESDNINEWKKQQAKELITSRRTEEVMLDQTFCGYTEEMTIDSESELDVKKKKSKSKLEFYFFATIFTLLFPVFLALVLFSSAVELYFDAVGNLYNKYKE